MLLGPVSSPNRFIHWRAYLHLTMIAQPRPKRRTDHAAQIDRIRAETVVARAQADIDRMRSLAQAMHDRIASMHMAALDTGETVN